MGSGRQTMDAEYLHGEQMTALPSNIQHNYPMRKTFSRVDHSPSYGGKGNYVIRANCMLQKAINIEEVTCLMNIGNNVMDGLERLRN